MKLYIDDIRDVPDPSWTLCRNITEAIRCIAWWGDEITEISLDHDISFEVRVEGTYRPFPSPDTFCAVAYFIGCHYENLRNMCSEDDFTIPKITVHSASIVGCEAIQHILGRYAIPCEVKPMGQAHRKK